MNKLLLLVCGLLLLSPPANSQKTRPALKRELDAVDALKGNLSGNNTWGGDQIYNGVLNQNTTASVNVASGIKPGLSFNATTNYLETGASNRAFRFTTTALGSGGTDFQMFDLNHQNQLGSGTLEAMTGYNVNFRLSTAGSTNYAYGAQSIPILTGSGSINNYMAFRSRTPSISGSGVITNAYGLFLEPLKVANVSFGWSVYQQGASDQNFFAGNTVLGNASNNTTGSKLLVEGNTGGGNNLINFNQQGGSRALYVTRDVPVAARPVFTLGQFNATGGTHALEIRQNDATQRAISINQDGTNETFGVGANGSIIAKSTIDGIGVLSGSSPLGIRVSRPNIATQYIQLDNGDGSSGRLFAAGTGKKLVISNVSSASATGTSSDGIEVYVPASTSGNSTLAVAVNSGSGDVNIQNGLAVVGSTKLLGSLSLNGNVTISGSNTLTAPVIVSPSVDVKLHFVTTASSFTSLGALPPVRVFYNNSEWVRKTGSITPDGGTTISGPAGFYYVVAKKQITPADFGADEDSTTDDAVALQKWLNVTGNYELYLPEGEYLSSTELTRINKGKVTIRGTGRISFPNNTNGIRILNTEAKYAGTIIAEDVRVRSTGPKTAKDAWFIQGLHNVGPYKHRLANLYTESTTSGQEWDSFYHIHNTSRLDLNSPAGIGATLTTTNGIRLSNDAGVHCMEIAINDPKFYTVRRGIYAIGNGYPAIEGVRINGGQLVGNAEGIYALSNDYSAPHFAINDTHINTMGGGAAINVRNFSQVTFTKPVVYVDRNPGVPLPEAAIITDSPVDLLGEVFIYTSTNLPNAFLISGSGGIVDLKIQHNKEAAPTNSLSVASGITQAVRACITPIWTGNTSWGSAQGKDVVGNVERVDNSCPAEPSNTPMDGGVQRYSYGNFRKTYVAGHAAAARPLVATSSSLTVDPSLTGSVLVFNGANPVTITVDMSKPYIAGQDLYIERGDENSSGAITVQTHDPANRRILGADNYAQSSYMVSTTSGRRYAQLEFTTTHLRLLGGGEPPLPSPQLTVQTVINANYTLQLSDLGKTITVSSSNLTITVPKNLPVGWWCDLQANNITSNTNVFGVTDVFVNYTSGYAKLAPTPSGFGRARLECISGNWFALSGSVTN